MNNVFLLTGGNLGDSLQNLATALHLLEQQVGVIKRVSAIYETEPWGVTEQPFYHNQIVEILTPKNAHELMDLLLSIEKKIGRIRAEKYGPRIIDIDILFFNSEVINTDNLVVPHPRIQERRFVLEPMNEIAPEFVHPVLQQTISELLSNTADKSIVKKI